MGFLGRLLVLAGAVLAIGVAIWLSITVFAVLLVVGGVAVLGVAAKQFLIAKGILNPTPGVPRATDDPVTVIEGEFEQVENPMVEKDR